MQSYNHSIHTVMSVYSLASSSVSAPKPKGKKGDKGDKGDPEFGVQLKISLLQVSPTLLASTYTNSGS